MKAGSSWFVAACLAVSVASLTLGCDGFLGSSKMAHGERYQSEDARFDPYFDAVHQQQVAAASWPDEKKAARRPLIGLLALTPSASDDTIVSATRERAKKLGAGGAKLDVNTAHVTPVGGANDPALFAAIEEVARLEIERAHKLKALIEKLDEMAKHGEELKKTADREYENRGAEKADPKKSEKRNEIRRELGGAADASRSLARDAARLVRDAEELIEDLGSALEAKDTPARGRGARGEPKALPAPKAEEPKKEEPKKEEPKKEAPKPKPEIGKKPKPVPAEKPPAEKPPTEKPAPKPPTPLADEFAP